jgi:CheY-like chemotaxis protein
MYSPTVMVIDDCDEALMLQRMVLEQEGFKVVTATSGSEALRKLKNEPSPQMVFLDVQMNDMSGFEFLEQLALDSPDLIRSIPIVLLTGLDEVPESRAVDFLRKPVGIDELIQCARRHTGLLASPSSTEPVY